METEVEIGRSDIKVVKGYPKETNKKWGDWIFKDNLTLVNVAYKEYVVDLDKMCRDEMLNWIFHLTSKSHTAPRDVGFFVYACKDIFDEKSQYATDPKKLFKINGEYMKISHNGKE